MKLKRKSPTSKSRVERNNEKLATIASNLHINVDAYDKKQKVTIVFLHGIASNIGNWRRVHEKLSGELSYVSVDLLGFGESPVPNRADYSVSTHAKAVWLSLDRVGITGKVIIVGHSMGCIIASHMATLRPKSVQELFLCSLPVYYGNELHKKNISFADKLITKLYFNMYGYLREDALFTSFLGSGITKLIGSKVGFSLRPRNFISFRRSLKNCIEFQDTSQELHQLDKPVHFYYGKYDVLALKKYIKQAAKQTPQSRMTSVKSGHVITDTFANIVASDINNSLVAGVSK